MNSITWLYHDGNVLAMNESGNLLAAWLCPPNLALVVDLFNANQHIGQMIIRAYYPEINWRTF